MPHNAQFEIEQFATVLDHPVSSSVFCGLDGFVDEIIHVVDQRQSAAQYTRIKTIAEYAERIARAAGVSTNIEYVPVQTKLGGNGPIFANALANAGADVVYVGALGDTIEPVFEPMCRLCREVISLGPSARTDAVEFYDGKLIISKLSAFHQLTYERLIQCVGRTKLIASISAADIICFANWTMLPHMSDIWRRLLDEILPHSKQRGYAFFDLADPQKRSTRDVREALLLLREFGRFRRVILSLNVSEARQIATIAGVEETELEGLARRLSDVLGVHGVVLHPVKEACCVLGGDYAHRDGPYCEKPVLITGAGDNFNAGFCAGLLRGMLPAQCLLWGMATSGYYVRRGHSPNQEQLRDFLRNWSAGTLD